MKTLQLIYPGLCETLSALLHLRCEKFSSDITVGELIEWASSDERELIFSEFLRGAVRHLSNLFVRTLERESPSGLPEKIYPLFMLAKYICQEQGSFALKIPEVINN